MSLRAGESREFEEIMLLRADELRELEESLRNLYHETSIRVKRLIDNRWDSEDEVRDEFEISECRKQENLRWDLVERDIRTLKDIEAAIIRLENDKFGKCSDCEAEIPISRLRILPFAKRCIKCQEIFERRHL